MTEHSMEMICDKLKSLVCMDGIIFMDLGSGLNKPSMHVGARFPEIKLAVGIEYMPQRDALSNKVSGLICSEIRCGSIAHTIGPFTSVQMDAMRLRSTALRRLGVKVSTI
jgi:hypothetical protein